MVTPLDYFIHRKVIKNSIWGKKIEFGTKNTILAHKISRHFVFCLIKNSEQSKDIDAFCRILSGERALSS
ncbi:hypothetical protein [Marinibactrum halimedae]|uniref:hypothetical protein n=1 Tax=Marinibactrum halimedae TaxID=1444977 RepID=UPI001E5B8F63|nr:hypothetical protein [Marinibactrum halimedae]MCD9460916.1 hypothetical protein [Marinibactrum halimedae]